jgi:hypothetical protein
MNRATRPHDPTSLGSLQAWFQRSILQEGSPRARVAGRFVKPSSSLSALERVQIYRDAYRERLVECLIDDYPALEYALGSEVFAQLCREYIAAHPSRSPSLNFFGKRMAAFCRSREGWELRRFAGDLAALEWALVEVLHAKFEPSVTQEALSRLTSAAWVQARFVPSQAVRVVRSHYPVNSYLQAFRKDERPEIPAPRRAVTVVWRQDLTVWRRELDRLEANVLTRLLSGVPIARALRAIEGSAANRDPNPVAGWFRRWVSDGFFVGILSDGSGLGAPYTGSPPTDG